MKNLAKILTVSFLMMGFANFVHAQQIDGEWKITKGVYSGQTVPDNILKSMELMVKNGEFTAKSGGKTSKGNVIVVPGRDKIKQATFTINEGGDAGRKINAIFKFENSRLSVAYSQDGSFPSDFTSTQSNQNLVLTYLSSRGAREISTGRGGKKVFGLPAPTSRSN